MERRLSGTKAMPAAARARGAALTATARPATLKRAAVRLQIFPNKVRAKAESAPQPMKP